MIERPNRHRRETVSDHFSKRSLLFAGFCTFIPKDNRIGLFRDKFLLVPRFSYTSRVTLEMHHGVRSTYLWDYAGPINGRKARRFCCVLWDTGVWIRRVNSKLRCEAGSSLRISLVLHFKTFGPSITGVATSFSCAFLTSSPRSKSTLLSPFYDAAGEEISVLHINSMPKLSVNEETGFTN